MPFIHSSVSVAMTEEKKQIIKEKLGEAITIIPGKSENWLMLEFSDNCDLYFQGSNEKPAAFIEVKVYGNISDDAANEMTRALCEIYGRELGIDGDRIYVKYEPVSQWGWNGSNF